MNKADSKNIKEIKELLKDLVWFHSLFVHELIRITENTRTLVLKNEVPKKCQMEHKKLQKIAVKMAKKWKMDNIKELENHILGHKQE